MNLTARDRLKLLGGLAGYAALQSTGLVSLGDVVGQAVAATPKNMLRAVLVPEPPTLNTAFNTAIMVQQISPKMLEGLIGYDKEFNPTPSLATAWELADDGLSITFKLRDGVTWHDGKPFTSADVKFTFEEILSQHHPRGRATFANLTEVETPDELTAVMKLSTPSNYIMSALSASESPMLPKHIYEGSDPIGNPANTKPIGTGPFKFSKWEKGQYLLLDKNEDYWQEGRPLLDRLFYRFIPDAGTRAAAFETGEIDLGGTDPVSLSDIARVEELPDLAVTTEGYALCGAMYYFEFNMRDPQFQDVRVRQAVAHAIDKDFVAQNIWFGFASPATGPISQKLSRWYNPDVPSYPFDTAKAEALLDEAGFPRQSDGVRFRMTHDPSTYTEQYRRFAEYFRQAMKVIGIEVEVMNTDAPTFSRRVWGTNEYQTASYGIFNLPDPTIGVQRMFWSKNIRPGVPYTNGSGYASAEMDQILEAAQTAVDPAEREALFYQMQVLAMTELPIIPLLNIDYTTVYNTRVSGITDDLEGVFGSFANVSVT
ncbi:ABC transporter substrate-binding protein [Acuticoccus sediminis]|uniref:ABC transporter substrate-binding protein n=1 Tax=Acuticoccus sediminis TaxID=2184697 RepID=A0A8B2NL19_9HYPH|nr:ABC transporter substrate-binding protein [Acuticoccus sediminis]RAH99250.1 ABC transporter substrate-binding protein [Acuticoccus sediminis]